MKLNRRLILIILIILLLGAFCIAMARMDKNNTQESNIAEDDNNSEQTLEDIYGESNAVTTDPLQIEIVSPEEETFIPRQARMWNAKISNFTDNITRISSCDWKFYLNENNEEALYKEQETRVVLSKGKENSCGFTSTFIESRGELRAEVILNVKDIQGNIIETVKAERKFRVQ